MTINWVHFRANVAPASYPGDGTGNTYNIGGTFPTAQTFGPYSQGWAAAYAGTVGDDSLYNSQHLAGFATSTAGVDGATFQIGGLTVGHNYKLYVAMSGLGSGGASPTLGFNVYAGASRTSLIVGYAGSAIDLGKVMDATGVIRTDQTDWLANQAAYSFTATGTSIYFCKASSNAWFNALGLEDLSAAPSATGSLALLGVG